VVVKERLFLCLGGMLGDEVAANIVALSSR